MSPAKKKKSSSSKKPSQAARREKSASPRPGKNFPAGWGLLVSLILIVAGLLSLPNFNIMFPAGSFLARVLVHPSLLFIGFFGLLFYFYRLPEAPKASELSKWVAYPWFALFFALCAYSRFYKPGEACSDYWFDFLVVFRDIRAILDVHDYDILFPAAVREPFFPYFTAGLWYLFPHATGLWIVRVSSGIIDLAAIWGLYRLGSAIRGRRMGLILMAFWALSMPMTFWCYLDGGTNSTVLACIWAIFFFVRLIQNPSMSRFIYWSLSLVFGACSYVPFRPWAPVMITAVILWIHWKPKVKPKGWAPWVLSIGLWLSWAFLFFYRNNFLHSTSFWVSVAIHPWFLTAVFILLVTAYLKTGAKAKGNETNRRIFGWATGSVLAALLSAPLMFNPIYAAHTSEASIFHVAGQISNITAATFQLLWSQMTYFFGMMFALARFGLNPYPTPGHSYLDAFPELGMVIGLAYLLTRPSWLKTFFVFLVMVGMVPFIFAQIQHSGRVSAAVAPLFIIGAWGLDYFWSLFTREMKLKRLRQAVFLLLLGFWAWDAHSSFAICRQWMAQKDNDVMIGEQIEKDWRQYYVVIAPFQEQFATPALTLLCDQKEAYVLNDPNPIFAEPGENGKDIVLLMYGYDSVLEARVKKEFPQAQWTVTPGITPALPRTMERVLIPFNSLSETKGKLFYIQRVPRDYWRRRFYCREYGVAHGWMWWDERVPGLNWPFPAKVDGAMSAEAESRMTVSRAGDYTFKTKPTTNVLVLSVDGKTLIELRPVNGTSLQGTRKIHLEPGDHTLDLVVNFRSAVEFPDIEVNSPRGEKSILGKVLENKP